MRPVRTPRFLAALLLAALAFAAGCGGGNGGTPRSLILISVDTLRPDRLGCYGHPGARTPFWDRVARRGAQFETALSSAPFTLPSHASLLSGEEPFSHRARRNGSGAFAPPRLTLTEAMSRTALRCAAVTASTVLDSTTGLQRGFELFEWQDRPGQDERSARSVTASALRWIESLPERARYFLFLHLYDPHDPYEPPPPWDRAVADAYDGEIAYADRALSRLFLRLEMSGRLDQTMVVALSDHGEAFGEHGEEGHGFLIHDTTLRVPLVLWGPMPFRGGAIRTDVARLIDVLPTVLDAFRFGPDWRLPGRNLQDSELDDPLEAYAESFEAALRYGASDLRSLRVDDWKYIRAPREELYDVRRDPGETRNRVEIDPERAAALREQLEEMLGDDVDRPAGLGDGESAIDAEKAAQLESLGYTGGGRLPVAGAGLRDPKDLVSLPRLLDRAEELEREESWDDLLTVAAQVLEKDAANRTAWRLRARERFARGSESEGLDVYAAAVEAHPKSPALWADYGAELLRAGRAEDARGALRKAVKLDPASSNARVQLAMAAIRTGLPRVAWKEVLHVLEREPDHPMATRIAEELEAQNVPRPEGR